MIVTYDDLPSAKTVGPVDVCVIGSGAGGGPMAYYLARAGLSVVVVEKGGYYPPEELGRREVALLTRIQSMTIFTPTEGKHTRVSLIAGECFGGGTLASEGAGFDFPDVIKDDWEKLGLTSFSRANKKLHEYQAEVNKRYSVKPVRMEYHNKNNQMLILAAQREGIKWKHAHRPAKHCMRCGNCTQGCRYGAKQDAARTFLKWARRKGAEAYCGAEVERISVNYPGPDDHPWAERLSSAGAGSKEDVLRELASRKAEAPAKFTVFARVTDRKTPPPREGEPDSKGLTIHARRVVMAAGPIGDSRILFRSGINPDGVVGKRFTTHPSAFTLARFPDNVTIRGWDGMTCSAEVHHYSDTFRDEPYFDPDRHGFILEGALSLPWGMANLLPGTGRAHLELMKRMDHMGGVETIVKSDSYGEIKEDRVVYDISEADNERLLSSAYLMSKLMFRVGAIEVFTGLPGLTLTSPAQLDEIHKYRRGKQKGFMIKQANLYSGHIFGGLVMGVDPKGSFADETGECHRIKGLWVADGSAFPTNTGVNCLISITLVARKIADEFIAKMKEVTTDEHR